jgi:hypothetical protein
MAMAALGSSCAGEVIALLLDIARRGPALVVLQNTDKLALKLRGSGVISDRVEIVYECRDLTNADLNPKKDNWTECLPLAGEEAWLSKSKRRKKSERYRLGFLRRNSE